MAKPSGAGRRGGGSDPRVRKTPATAFQSSTQDSKNAREGGSKEHQRAQPSPCWDRSTTAKRISFRRIS